MACFVEKRSKKHLTKLQVTGVPKRTGCGGGVRCIDADFKNELLKMLVIYKMYIEVLKMLVIYKM